MRILFFPFQIACSIYCLTESSSLFFVPHFSCVSPTRLRYHTHMPSSIERTYRTHCIMRFLKHASSFGISWESQ